MECTETVRLRVVIEDRKILTKSQKLNGLKRTWLLLKPQHHTISDLTSHLISVFNLDRCCPNGLLLSMDGFVLPPFESTSILKDKDIVCVKKKGDKLSAIVNLHAREESIEEVDIVDTQPVLNGLPLLANEEYEKETGGYESEHEEDEDHPTEDTLPVVNSSGGNGASKKKKATKKLQISERKRRRPIDIEPVGKDVGRDDTESPHKDILLPGKRPRKKAKISTVKNDPDIASIPGRDGDIVDSVCKGKRSTQLQENGAPKLNESQTQGETKKVPSRSARRKKAKRQWQREIARIEREELNEKQPAVESPPKKIVEKKGLMALFPDQSSDAEDEVVPVVIRPGHIRFEPLGGNVVQQKSVPTDTFKWNGTTSKKKGQKWGKQKLEKFSSYGRNDHEDVNEEQPSDMMAVEEDKAVNDPVDIVKLAPSTTSPKETFKWNGTTSKRRGQEWGTEKLEKKSSSRRNDHEDVNEECSGMMAVEEEKAVNDPIDFDKLAPFTRSPKEGDIIAYRLLELTSTWTPEISSFRVGKISSYDAGSNKVVLIQVPEYPIPIVYENVDDEDDTSLQQPVAISLYNEDGSLEIDFTALVDIRCVGDHGNDHAEKAVSGTVTEGSAANKDVAASDVDIQTSAPIPVEKEVVNNGWDEISEALNSKKAELSKEEEKSGGGKSGGWSYRAMRGAALGPTMALLRAKNDI